MVVIEKMQLSKTTTFQLTFSNGADEKSCVLEINEQVRWVEKYLSRRG